MVKINKLVENLEDVLSKIEDKLEELEEQKQSIIDNACDHDRELTSAEERRIDKIDEDIEELEGEADDIQNSLDYLRNYTD